MNKLKIDSKLGLKNTVDNVSQLSSTLKSLLTQEGLNATELAHHINVPQPTIHRLLTGKTDDPRLSTLRVLANYFRVSLDQLLGYSPIQPFSNKLCIHTLPIISWKDAIESKKFLAQLPTLDWKDYFVSDSQISSESFGLISKPSMESRFPTGTILLVDTKMTPSDGNLIIVHYKDTHEATIRRLILDGPKQLLSSIADLSQFDELTEDIRIIGVVVQARFNCK